MTIITLVLIMLIAGLVVGLLVGFAILCIDQRRKHTKIVDLKDGITLEYDCSQPGIYERIRAFINDD
jgi:hypothetical protein